MNASSLAHKMKSEAMRISYFLRTGYYSRGERVNPDFPDANFQNHFKVYRFLQQYAVGKDVIDVGCGTGYGTAHLAEVAKSVVGIDISKSALKWARKHYPGVRFARMDAQHLRFPDRFFDLVVSTENFEHLPDQRGHVRELARVLRPDGLCFVATPNPEMFTDSQNRYHTKENSFDELMELFHEDFQEMAILENTEEPRTKEGLAMRERRRQQGSIGIRSLAGIDTTWLNNTHSFFCFGQRPIGSKERNR
jgi:ubiquinone/menaquinone biosynthesis C-methylase UbiE